MNGPQSLSLGAILLAGGTGALAATEGGVVEWDIGDGQRSAFDGVFYSYANYEGQGIKLWIPLGEEPVRGVILFGNPGGGPGGDTRNKSRQRDVVEFAARHRFGVGGVTGFPGRETYRRLGDHVVTAFRAWGRHGRHPELEHVPFIFSGSSNAGVFSFAMMMVVPERTICITPNVGPVYGGVIDERVRGVPAWLHVGTTDPFFPHGVRDTEALFAEHAPQDALWTWEAEIKGHENGASDHVDVAYWNSVIPLRLPVGRPADRDENVVLRPLDPAAGWAADFRTWDYHLAHVFPRAETPISGHRAGHCGWLPDEGIARIYRAAASRTRQLALSFVRESRVEGGASSGVYLSSGGSQLVSPGEVITVRVQPAPLVWGLETIEIYDRAGKLGQFDARETWEFSFTVADQAVYALHARAHRRGGECISNPLQVVVRDPDLSAAVDAQWALADWLPQHRPRAVDPRHLPRLTGGAGDPVESLPALPAGSAAPSPVVRIDARCDVKGQNATPVIAVAATYGVSGFELRFRIDDGPVRDGASTPPGRLDVHLASVGLPHVRATRGSLDTFAAPALNALLRHAVQVAFDVGTEAPEVSLNTWEPWDMGNVMLRAEDRYAGTGLRISTVAEGPSVRTVTVLFPWAMVGNPGLTGPPPVGTSLAVVIGCDLPDGTAKLRWPHARDPWSTKLSADTDVSVFGQIVIQP